MAGSPLALQFVTIVPVKQFEMAEMTVISYGRRYASRGYSMSILQRDYVPTGIAIL
jgi:hypothetical protein